MDAGILLFIIVNMERPMQQYLVRVSLWVKWHGILFPDIEVLTVHHVLFLFVTQGPTIIQDYFIDNYDYNWVVQGRPPPPLSFAKTKQKRKKERGRRSKEKEKKKKGKEKSEWLTLSLFIDFFDLFWWIIPFFWIILHMFLLEVCTKSRH